MKEMITGSTSLPFSFFLRCPPFHVPFAGWTNIHDVVDDGDEGYDNGDDDDDDDDDVVEVNTPTS